MSNVRPPMKRIRSVDQDGRHITRSRCPRSAWGVRPAAATATSDRLGRRTNAYPQSNAKSSWANTGIQRRMRGSVQSRRRRLSRLPCGVPQRGVAGSAKASASPMPCGVCALGCQECQALAAFNETQEEQSPLRLWSGAQFTSSWRERALFARWPNPSIERTSNGGARLFAPSRSVAPLAAAHVKR